MKPEYAADTVLEELIKRSIEEDVSSGDHTSLALVPSHINQDAVVVAKDSGILAGIEVCLKVFSLFDPTVNVAVLKMDGDVVESGDVVVAISGNARSILTMERLVLNCMQRMSGIATKVSRLNKLLEGTKAKLLDTRKTTPGFRVLEKWAVRIGGGQNHRYGLFDMIMIKDNHIEYAGGIGPALDSVRNYLAKSDLDLRIEIETTNIDQVKEVLDWGKVDVIMLDNMTCAEMTKCVQLINGACQVEASGNITEHNIAEVAQTGVDFISMGALTHSYKSLDLSLKAISNDNKD